MSLMSIKPIYEGLFCLLISGLVVACNSGSSSSSSSTNYAVTPSPYPPIGDYKGVPYNQLGNPPGLNNYPNAYFPTFSTNSNSNRVQIAYGRTGESAIMNLTANVAIPVNNAIATCTATPIKYDSVSNSTFFVGAAHCFVTNKPDPQIVTTANLIPLSTKLLINYGLGPESTNFSHSYMISAIYVMQNYCQGRAFFGLGNCANFVSSDGGQGNDLAVIQISGRYATPESYPIIARQSAYPEAYTMAPILSIGYGYNTQVPSSNDWLLGSKQLYYVANYYYWNSDSPGYHYLYNSYFNPGYGGYAGLICGGDSGGGDLFWNGTNWILLSEHTYGPLFACGQYYNYLPNGATNVSAYYDWIQSIINSPIPVTDCQSGAIPNCVTNG